MEVSKQLVQNSSEGENSILKEEGKKKLFPLNAISGLR